MNIHEAFTKWDDNEKNSGSVETGKKTLTVLRVAALEAGANRLVNACDKLLHIYTEFVGDTDGEATMTVYEEYSAFDQR